LRKIFTERFGSGSGRSIRSPTVAICGEREEERKKKELSRTSIYDRLSASLVPYRVQRAPARVAPFVSTWRTPLLAGSVRAPLSLAPDYTLGALG
jgi:hypothetical protein